MDKTFAESQGQAPFDWNQWLDYAIRTGVTEDEADEAEARACDWVSCACGNQCAIIPRDEDGAPLDKDLNKLGIEFNCWIQEQNFEEAKRVLALIEERSSELIADELAKLSPSHHDSAR